MMTTKYYTFGSSYFSWKTTSCSAKRREMPIIEWYLRQLINFGLFHRKKNI